MSKTEQRAKYDADQLKALGAKGQAFKNANGDWSFPISDEADLANAIRAVGRAGADHDAVRKYIIRVAKKLGLSDRIPDNWAADGSISQANAASDDTEQRADMTACPTCDGTGQVDGQDCPECNGTGEVPTDEEDVGTDGQGRSDDPVLERRRRLAADLEGTFETRRFDANSLELRELSDGTLRFTGYASVTEHPYEVSDFTETISRGAFKRTLGEGPDVVLLVNHEGLPLARTKSGTLTLTEDARGLRVDADLDPEDPDVRALVPKMRRGDVDQMSFAFRATEQEWSEDYSDRRIAQVSIHRGDVSVVTMAANEAATGTIIRSTDGEFELRAGKTISAANQQALQGVLDRMAKADVELDAGQAELADVLGVPNPDQDDEAGEPDETGDQAPQRSLNYTAIRARERLILLERGVR